MPVKVESSTTADHRDSMSRPATAEQDTRPTIPPILQCRRTALRQKGMRESLWRCLIKVLW